jgi:hypothetical protein
MTLHFTLIMRPFDIYLPGILKFSETYGILLASTSMGGNARDER